MSASGRRAKKAGFRETAHAQERNSEQKSDSDQNVRTLYSGLHHELRTPLDAILGFSEFLMDDAEKKGLHDMVTDLRKINLSGRRLLTLMCEVLDPGENETTQSICRLEDIGARLRHELRTPLNAILGYSEMLMEDVEEAGLDDFTGDLQKIDQAGKRFLDIINSIADFSEIEYRDMDLSLKSIDRSSMIQDLMSTIRPPGDRTATAVYRGSVLVVDDNETNRDLLTRYLERQGHTVTAAENGRRALEIMKTDDFDLILLDIMMPEMNGFHVLQHLKSQDAWRDIPVIVISGLDEMECVVMCIQMGAEDYLLKPFNQVLLKARIMTCLEKKRLREMNEALERRNLKEEVQFVAESRAMRSVLNTVRSIRRNPVNVLIHGDSGAGKEVISRIIHSGSDRKDKPFVAVNCASIPENLMESEFFGYEKGAFTGAVSSRGGRFEEAHGGTLFLDEIGDMPMVIQPKFLRVLQEGEGSRLGSNKPVRYDLRIISATNKDLRQEVAEGRFREDLFYRLFSVEIHIPPLKERREDIVPLVMFFIDKVSRRFKKKIAGFSPEVLNFFEEYNWPGNVRQLLHEVEQLVALTPEGEWATLGYCSQELQGRKTPFSVSSLTKEPDLPLTEKIKELEISFIKDALRKTGGNKRQASKMLGLTRQGLDNKIKRYKISI